MTETSAHRIPVMQERASIRLYLKELVVVILLTLPVLTPIPAMAPVSAWLTMPLQEHSVPTTETSAPMTNAMALAPALTHRNHRE